MAGQTHPFQSEFTGSATPAGSFSTADRVAIRQSTGNVTVIDKGHGVVDTFDASGSYLSQLGPFSFSTEPDIAIDNSATASEGNLYVMPEFQPLSAYDSSGTLLYQLDGSTTPDGPFGDACGLAVDSSGILYVGDYGHQKIYKFDSAGTYLETLNVGFTVCDIAVATDGTIWAVQYSTSVHKLAPDGTDLGVIDDQSPRGVGVDLSNNHPFVVHDSSVIEYDPSGAIVSNFGASELSGARGVDINTSTGNVYVSSSDRVVIFGPLVPVPDATTGDATNVAQTTATLNGHVDPADAGDIIDCHFEYGTDTTYGTSVPCVPAVPIESPTDVSADISGLTPSTIYHFTLVVSSGSAGSVSGNDNTFQTTGPPIVQSQPATNITENSATLNAAVDPAGFETTCVFQYVDDASFQATGYTGATSAPCVPASVGSVGGAFVAVSADVSGLASSTLYHFRAVATNSAGTTTGDDTTFRTAGIPAVTSETATNVTDTTAMLNATVIPSGFDTTCQFQYVADAAFQGSGYSTATSVDCSPFDLGSSFDPQTTSASATGLTPGTVYHFRVVATNSAGTTNGDDTTFTTLVSFLSPDRPVRRRRHHRRPVPDPDRGGRRSAGRQGVRRRQRECARPAVQQEGAVQSRLGMGRQGRPGAERGLQDQDGLPGGRRRRRAPGSSRFPRASRSTAPRARRRAACTSATPATTWSRSSPPGASTCRRSTAAPPRRVISSASRAWPSTRPAPCGSPMPAPATSRSSTRRARSSGSGTTRLGLRKRSRSTRRTAPST